MGRTFGTVPPKALKSWPWSVGKRRVAGDCWSNPRALRLKHWRQFSVPVAQTKALAVLMSPRFSLASLISPTRYVSPPLSPLPLRTVIFTSLSTISLRRSPAQMIFCRSSERPFARSGAGQQVAQGVGGGTAVRWISIPTPGTAALTATDLVSSCFLHSSPLPSPPPNPNLLSPFTLPSFASDAGSPPYLAHPASSPSTVYRSWRCRSGPTN